MTNTETLQIAAERAACEALMEKILETHEVSTVRGLVKKERSGGAA